ncbi:hypothetical protein QQS21_006124 [Conoideocrella luteorostrata]|uniref:Uncharacterized protein n=1 Tax=Conoideocrella luteorostrata TaxID=1105319 RepID=A0AAJ0CQX7_9HYPO|nr:hypothetical protein QQS21_006124 [Conoideocrella luteorostrata]
MTSLRVQHKYAPNDTQRELKLDAGPSHATEEDHGYSGCCVMLSVGQPTSTPERGDGRDIELGFSTPFDPLSDADDDLNMDSFGDKGQVGSGNASMVVGGAGGDERNRGSELMEVEGADSLLNPDIALDKGISPTAPHMELEL